MDHLCFLEQKTNLNHMKKYVEMKIFVKLLCPKDAKTLEYKQKQKSDKPPFVIQSNSNN